MTTLDPITPPQKLLYKWDNLPLGTREIFVIAAQWGADQELEACCGWLAIHFAGVEKILRSARRPNPPSLREKALEELNLTADPNGAELSRTQVELIRRALEQLDD